MGFLGGVAINCLIVSFMVSYPIHTFAIREIHQQVYSGCDYKHKTRGGKLQLTCAPMGDAIGKAAKNAQENNFGSKM